MHDTIIARTYAGARRAWRRLLGTWLLVLVASSLVAFFVDAVVLGPDPSAGRMVVAAIVGVLVLCWALLAMTRVAMRDDPVLDAVGGAVGGAPRLLLGIVALTALVVPVLLVIPLLVLIAAHASEEPARPLRESLAYGVRQLPRNLVAYVSIALAMALPLAVAAAALLGPLVASAGMPRAGDLADPDALLDWLVESPAVLAGGALLASVPLAIFLPALAAATYRRLRHRAAVAQWRGEDLEPTRVAQEISPAVAALLGGSDGMQPSHPARRMAVPPRADVAGRLPGPGAMTVGDVDLPAGGGVRPVDAPTAELGDAGPGGVGSMVSPVTASATPAMWASSVPLDPMAPTWKRLGAAFAESGLWPLLLPEGDGRGGAWFERRGRRERDSIDASANELFRRRVEESIAADTPLASTALIAASSAARGELHPGSSGRRPDALDLTIDELGPSRLGLVPARSPAECVHRLAWPGTAPAGITGIELASLLASWEERHGALLLGMTESSLVLAVLRPPATLEEAIEVAAEHHALCPDEAHGWGDDRSYAEQLLDAPTWRLTWD